MRKKVRLSISRLVYEVMEKDIAYFGMKRETLYNSILQGIGFENVLEIGYTALDEKI